VKCCVQLANIFTNGNSLPAHTIPELSFDTIIGWMPREAAEWTDNIDVDFKIHSHLQLRGLN
jgi:hypothetical protein